MFRRLLTFTLAGILTFETPVTTYAANTMYVNTEISQTGESLSEDSSNPIEVSQNIEDSQNTTDSQDTADDQDTLDSPDAESGQDNEDSENGKDSASINNKDNENNEPDSAEPSDSLQSTDDIIEIDYNKALNEGVTITAPKGSANSAYYSITVPEDGQYALYSENTVENGKTYIKIRSDIYDTSYENSDNVDRASYLAIPTRYKKSGEKIYIEIYNANSEETYNMRIAKQTLPDSSEDNSYSYALPDGNKVEINTLTGYGHIKFNAAVRENTEAGSGLLNRYILSYYYEYEDGAELSKSLDSLFSNNGYSCSETISCEKDSVYNSYYMVTDGSYHFVALLAGTSAIKIGSTDEKVYIHDAVCEEDSILLDVEAVDNTNIDCYYAPTDASEDEKHFSLDSGWNSYRFWGLRAGTEYTFKFYNKDKTVLYYTAKYRTEGTAAIVNVTDYAVRFDDDYNYMYINATVAGFGNVKSQEAEIHYQYIDSMGIKRSSLCTVNLSDGQTIEGTSRLANDVLLAGCEYDVKLWMYLPDDNMTTEAVTVKAKAPQAACIDESDIDFSVSQTESDGIKTGSVQYEISILYTKSHSVPELYYRRYNKSGITEPYKITSLNMFSAAFYKDTIDGLDIGSEYEFVLSTGGLRFERHVTLINSSGILLERVEDATDYTGPYDIIRTYQIKTGEGSSEPQGDYYLHLEYLKEGNGAYEYAGYVNLSADKNYKETISSAAIGNVWLQPDTDYILKWVLSSSQPQVQSQAPDISNTETVWCENIHTSMAKAKLTKGRTGFDHQYYTLALDEEDTANLKTNNRKVVLYGYIKAEGSVTTLSAAEFELDATDNYTETFKLTNLLQNTNYELYIKNGKYNASSAVEFAADSFTTAEGKREIKTESVTPAAGSAQINYSLNGFDEGDNGYIFCYARKKGYGEWKKQEYKAMQYIVSEKDFTFDIYGLDAATEYEYKIGYYRINSIINQSYLQYSCTGIFTTKTDNRRITVTSAQGKINTAYINYSLSGMEDAGKGVIQLFIRKKAGGGLWEYKGGKTYTPSSKPDTHRLSGLEEDTAYEYRIGFGTNPSTAGNIRELKNYVDGEFETHKDERNITVKPVNTKALSATIECTISGMENADTAYLLCYIREAASEGAWERKAARQILTGTENVIITLDRLTMKTSYEYIIGIGTSDITSEERLEKTVEGNFTTTDDLRKIEETVTFGITKAAIDCNVSGVEQDTYIFCYIREDIPEDETTAGALEWKQVGWKQVSEDTLTADISFDITGLKAQTAYRYKLGFYKYNGSVTIEKLEKVVENTFTTKADMRSLSGQKAVVDDDEVVFSAFFTGNTEHITSYVHFFYRESGASAYTKAERVVNMTNAESGECSASVKGLLPGTNYEFIVIISDTSSFNGSPDDIEKDSFKAAGNFTTNKADPPSEITLSQTELYLNANKVYRDVQNYGYQILKPEFTPDAATRNLIWESSNTNVATIKQEKNSDSVRINAVSTGTAVITVTSRYNSEASAVCNVVVGNYQLGYDMGSGSVRLLDKNELNLEKDMQYGGYKLCKIDDEQEPSVLPETAFSVRSNNEAILLWNEGIIATKGVGSTKLVFTADDKVPSYLDVNISAHKENKFTIIGFKSSNEEYPAKEEDEKDAYGNTQYTLAYTPGITYTAIGESIPSSVGFSNNEYDWYTNDEEVASVKEGGVVVPHKAGTVTLSATPKPTPDGGEAAALYVGEPACSVVLHIKDLPTAELDNVAPVYALADISAKIGDVKFPDDEAWKDWQWKDKDTPLIINGVNKEYYPFEAVYTGDEYYAQEAEINVYIAKVTGVSAYEAESNNHNKVVEVANTATNTNVAENADFITLTVESLYNGSLKYDEKTNYFYDVDIAPVNGLIIEKGDFLTEDSRLLKTFTIKASKKGNYTLKPVIKVKDKNNGNEKVLAKTSYKIKAVEDAQAYIKLNPVITSGGSLEGDRIIVNSNSDVSSFKVEAQLVDRRGESRADFASCKVVWSTADKRVASVKADKDSHTATVTIKGEGHTILSAKAGDAAGHSAILQIEIRNYAPRIDTSKVTVNLAYDYKSSAGRSLALNSLGTVEVIPAYKETVQSVDIYSSDKKNLSSDFSIYEYGASHKYLVCDTDSTKTGTYDCFLGVSTSGADVPYFYPLKITVVDKQAKVTAKSNRAVNLFYRSEPASIDISVSGTYGSIEEVTWTDNSGGNGNGFSSVSSSYASKDDTKRPKNIVNRFYFAQGDIKLTDNKKLEDPEIINGLVAVKLSGYKKANEGIKTKLKWTYKKPVIITKDAAATLLPSIADRNSASFALYNKTEGKDIEYTDDSYSKSNPKYYYNELSCNNKVIKFTKTDERAYYTYSGGTIKGSEKLRLTLKADDWREDISTTHTIKTAEAKPMLSVSKLTVNTTKTGTVYTNVVLNDGNFTNLKCDDIVIEAKDVKSKALFDKDLLEITQDKSLKYRINVRANRAETMNQPAIAGGTYTYKVTPYYTDTSGNRIKAKTLTLKITATNKEITAKTNTKGSLDLTKKANYVELITVFKNIGTDYKIVSSELIGEYSRYFQLYGRNTTGKSTTHRLQIRNEGKLKAGYKYKLAIRYTIRIGDGDTFVVKGQTFTVKPKQTTPKIKVANNNQTLYAAADGIYRTYNLSVVDSQYTIVDVEGSLDCNKDGKEDIRVEYSGSTNTVASAQVKITDSYGLLTQTGSKGKTYNIPVIVKLRGRDGISKDVKTKIKVTVKR